MLPVLRRVIERTSPWVPAVATPKSTGPGGGSMIALPPSPLSAAVAVAPLAEACSSAA
jgi:hypothetical protein